MLIGLALLVVSLPWGANLAYGNTGPAGMNFYANSPQGGASGTALRKFVDSLPGVGAANANNLGQYIPLATPDTTTYPGSDYYQLGIVQYTEKVHTDLPKATKFRGYRDLGGGQPAHYLGPLIVAQRDRPVRVKFTNQLPTGAAGNLFIPVDGTLMGAGMGPDGMTEYSQNRTSIHLHGTFSPWISDGTPHQWFTPAAEMNMYKQGVSLRNVPDMPDPGDGSNTLYWTNQQSNRLMFYHDHALGITRLNVYAGMAAGYLIHDPVEDNLINTGVIPNNGGGVYNWGIPLVIQDKSFVPQDIAVQDSKWLAAWGTYGDLWFPHVYQPNQNPTDPSGLNPMGRWDFGPWTQPNLMAPEPPPMGAATGYKALPGTTLDNPEGYNTSVVPESFMDTMMVNGTAYPYLNVQPTAYRFRILNACNDRFLNLQLYLDASGGGSGATATAVIDPVFGVVTAVNVTNGGAGYTQSPGIIFSGGGGFGAWATANVVGGAVTSITVNNSGRYYTSAPTVTIGAKTEVKMTPAIWRPGIPEGPYPEVPLYPTDNRDGGVPDPAFAGPKFIQIGSEGGFLPGVYVVPNQPVAYDTDKMSATFGNVKETALFLGPAERADVIVDFSGVAPGTNVILYNDAPAPVPANAARYDYFSGNPDQTEMGGALQTLPGLGPNTRTIMQFRVAGAATPAFNLAQLEAALPPAYVASQPPPIVPQPYFPAPYQAATETLGRINDTEMTYTPYQWPFPKTEQCKMKAITEIFESYGRMNALLGYETYDQTTAPFRQNGVGLAYINPPSDNLTPGQPQIWKLTHNGVDTHAIHFHLVNVQLINRVGWDNAVKPPDPNERGWKETIRMNPLETVYFAMKAEYPRVPFNIPTSIRLLNPTMPLGSTEGFVNFDPKTGNPVEIGPLETPITNQIYNFGNEFVWHCHLLGHEENDMMRPLCMYNVPPIWADILLDDPS
jgi:FtsP/CotA-like multicopper oxidase with cupredoxin domain